jgi:hypothetical protein
MNTEVKTCVNCKSFRGGQDAQVYYPHADPHGFTRSVNNGPECGHPKAATRDLVFGKAFCLNERNSKKGCGKQGKLWEAKTAAS